MIDKWKESWPVINRKELAKYVVPDWTADALNFYWADNSFDLANLNNRRKIVENIYGQLLNRKKRINYTTEKYNLNEKYQTIRNPDEILNKEAEGTCLDLSLLFCGLCLQRGLLPVLILTEGHAFVAISLNYSRAKGGEQGVDSISRGSELAGFKNGLLEEETYLKELINSGAYLAIECTGFADTRTLSDTTPEGNGREGGLMSFERAVEAGTEQLFSKSFLFAIEIDFLHSNGNPPFQPAGDLHFYRKIKNASFEYYHKISTSAEFKYFHENFDDYSIENFNINTTLNDTIPLETSIKRAWDNSGKSLILRAGPKKGKTSSCFCIWKKFLKTDELPTLIYISCKVLNDDKGVLNSPHPILNFIAKYYLKSFSDANLNSIIIGLQSEFQQRTQNGHPAYTIILDGFYELKSREMVEKKLLEFWIPQKARGTQVIITSEYDIQSKWEVQPLDVFTITENKKVENQANNGSSPLNIFVLSSTSSQLKNNNIPKDLLSEISKDRYHETDLGGWRPFKEKLTISELLNEQRNRYGYSFIDKYSDGLIPDSNEYVTFLNGLCNTIGIFDPLSLSPEINSRVTSRFDNARMNHKGESIILIPIDNSFSSEFNDYVDRKN